VTGASLPVFLAGESVAAWLTSTCDGELVAVQVEWDSNFGGNPAQLEQSISVFAPGAFPTPGPVLLTQGGSPAVIVTPSLVDGVVNEYRYLDPPSNTSPLRIAVSNGQQLVVSLKFLNQSSGSPFSSAPTHDADGCLPGRNAVDVLPGGWSDACPLGVTGDWVIRAVVDCADAVPAAPAWSRGAVAALLLIVGALGLGARRASVHSM